MGDTTKDVTGTVASAGVAMATTAAASGSILAGAIAGALAAIPGVFELGVGRVGNRDKRRAHDLLRLMAAGDDDPSSFLEALEEKLKADDPDTVTAFRDLLTATVSALAPSAIEPIALIGRQYVRKQCPPWVARGWLRILTELSDPEVEGLRELVRQGLLVTGRLNRIYKSNRRGNIELTHHKDRDNSFWTPSLIPHQTAFAVGYADRLVEMMQTNHLGYAELGEPSPFSKEPRPLFIVRAVAFYVLVDAMPTVKADALAEDAVEAADHFARVKAEEERRAAALEAEAAVRAARLAAARAKSSDK